MNLDTDNRLLDEADRALESTSGGRCESETSFLDRLLRELGGHVSAVGLSPAELFRAVLHNRPLMQNARNVLEVLAMPSQKPQDALRPGDWMLRAVPGTGDVGHVSVLASDDLLTPSALESEGITAEGTQPGYYGLVIDAGAFPHSRSRPFARRLLDSRGRVPPHTIFLRPRYPEVGTMPDLPSDEAGDMRLRPTPFLARATGSLTLDGFAIDSFAVTEKHRTQLRELAATLRALLDSYPTGSVWVTGHTDATGVEAHNLVLGQRRAETVRDALVDAGVPTTVIWARSAGEETLRVRTPQADPRNRRVIVEFQPEPIVPHDTSLTLRPPAQPGKTPRLSLDLPPPRPETLEERLQRFLKMTLPEIRRESLTTLFWRQVDDGLNSVMHQLGIPDWARDYVRKGAHGAIEKGAGALLDQGMDQANLTGEQREAIRAALRALLESKIVRKSSEGKLTQEWSEETGTVQQRARRAVAPQGRKLLPTDVGYLSFEGGGGKGSAFLGALAALVEPGIEILDARTVPGATVDFFLNTQKVKGIAGTSAGAITAALIASGYGLRELYGFMTNRRQLARFYDEPRDAKGNLERLVYSKAKTEIESRPAPRRDWVQEWVVSSSPLWRKILIEPQLFQLAESARLAGLLAVPLVAKLLAAWLGPMFPSAVKTITRNPEVLAKYLDNLTYDLGLFSGVEIWRVLDLMIGSKPTPAPGSGPLPDRRGITFAQHKALHGVELRLTGTNLETGESRLFSASNTPEFRVIDAVRISLSLPFFFKPFVIPVGPHRGTWIDGGILNNNPIHAFDDPDAPGTINPKLLGLRLGVDYPSPENPMRIRSTGDLAQALSTAMFGMSEQGQIRTPQERAQIISLQVDPLSTFEFVAGKDVLHAVCCRAARQTLVYFGLEAKGAGNVIPALFGQPCP